MTGAPILGVSVIIPTFRRPQALKRCLSFLAELSFPADQYEIIVVDDDGGIDLEPIVAAAGANVRLVTAPHGGPAAARNKGAKVARFENLAFIDDDCVADPDWLNELMRTLNRDPDSLVGGRVKNGLAQNPYARASQTLLTFLYRYYHQERRGRFAFFTTNNLAARKEIFTSLGGFDESFEFASEDREWSERCRQHGLTLVYAQNAVVHHESDVNLRGFLRQHFRYGKGAWAFHRARAHRGGDASGFEVEGADFYLRMLFAPFVSGDPSPISQSLLLFSSQAAGALGCIYAWIRGSVRRAQSNPYPRTTSDVW